MSVVIRLMRAGAKKRPFYRMVAAERLPPQITLAPVKAPPSPEPVLALGSVLPVDSGFPERRDGALSGGLVGS